MDEVKQKLSAERTKITKDEVKGLKRVCACEYYEVAHELAGVLLLNQLERDISPNFQEMARLVHAMIGHFMLFHDGSDFEEGETLSELVRKINKRIDAHLTTLPCTVNADEQAGGGDPGRYWRVQRVLLFVYMVIVPMAICLLGKQRNLHREYDSHSIPGATN